MNIIKCKFTAGEVEYIYNALDEYYQNAFKCAEFEKSARKDRIQRVIGDFAEPFTNRSIELNAKNLSTLLTASREYSKKDYQKQKVINEYYKASQET